MPEQSGGSTRPAAAGNAPNNTNTHGVSGPPTAANTQPRQQRPGGGRSRFQGRCPALHGVVYDVGNNNGYYTKTTEIIAAHVGERYKHAEDYRQGIKSLTLPTLTQPTPPTDTKDLVAFEIWKEANRKYNRDVESRAAIGSQVFGLIVGQCSDALLSRMKAHHNWSKADKAADVMELLRIIQGCMTQRQTRQHPPHTHMDSLRTILNFQQSSGMTNTAYYERFRDKVQRAHILGVVIASGNEGRVDTLLRELHQVDRNTATPDQISAATTAAEEEALAILIVRRIFGVLTHSLTRKSPICSEVNAI